MRLLLGKNCELVSIQSLTCIVVVCFVSCYFDGVDLKKSCINIVLVVSGVLVLGYKWGRILKKMAVVYLVFEKI